MANVISIENLPELSAVSPSTLMVGSTNGDTYKIQAGKFGLASSGYVANAFDANTAYTAGDYVTYNGILYKFTTDHPAGAWDASDVQTAVLGDDLRSLITYDSANDAVIIS